MENLIPQNRVVSQDSHDMGDTQAGTPIRLQTAQPGNVITRPNTGDSELADKYKFAAVIWNWLN